MFGALLQRRIHGRGNKDAVDVMLHVRLPVPPSSGLEIQRLGQILRIARVRILMDEGRTVAECEPLHAPSSDVLDLVKEEEAIGWVRV